MIRTSRRKLIINYIKELTNLCKYKNVLSENAQRLYASFLKKKILKEMTAANFANTLKHNIFNIKVVEDSEKATLKAVQKLRKANQCIKYERKHNQIVKNSLTHLETDDGQFCDKDTFRREFKKQKFEIQDDLAATTPEVMLEEYLKAYDDEGWLISTVDIEGYEEIKNKSKLKM